ncbi:MAG TPA: hypothetical protein PLB01_10250 [Thermoanaerobaculia bacterium]|nr:hypothetical protein [Thermoanaerobaculia bacterium]
MDEGFDLQKLRSLRKLTRAIAESLRSELREHLTTMTLLLRPRTILGDFVEGSVKGEVKGADAAFRDLRSRYESVAGGRPFGLPKELNPPIEILSSNVELVPLEYPHVAKSGSESKTVTVTQPLTWILTYSGLAPTRLRELMAAKIPDSAQVKDVILHALVLDTVLTKQPGLLAVFEALRFPVVTQKLPGLGELPVTCISSSVRTVRPPDDVLIESTEISGLNAFEEVVNAEDIVEMQDPFREKLLEVIKANAPEALKG